MLDRRTLAAAALLMPLLAPARAARADDSTQEFAVDRNGSPIGHHTLRFSRDGERLSVDIDILLEVKLAFITLYRYRHTNRELWEAGRLLELRQPDRRQRHRAPGRGAARGRGDPGRERPGPGRGAGRRHAQHLLAPPFPRCAGLDRHPGRPAPALQGHAHAA